MEGKQKRKVIVIVVSSFGLIKEILCVGSYRKWSNEMKTRKHKETWASMEKLKAEMNAGKIVTVNIEGTEKVNCCKRFI